jgi:hypothetical protein
MVSIWYSPQSRGEVVGDICSSHLQCDPLCRNELISSPETVYSSDSYLFNSLILGAFLLFLLVSLLTLSGILIDAVYWAAYLTTQIQPLDDEANHSDSLFQFALSLSEALTVEREKYFAREMRHGEGGEGGGVGGGLIYQTQEEMYDIEAVRESLYERYGKKTFIKHMAVSESNENNK